MEEAKKEIQRISESLEKFLFVGDANDDSQIVSIVRKLEKLKENFGSQLKEKK